MALVAGMSIVAFPIAQLLSGVIYENGGYMAIWGTSLGLSGCNLLYIVFYLKDSKGKSVQLAVESSTNNEKTVVTTIVEIEKKPTDCVLVLKNLWNCFVVTFRPRVANRRASVSLLLSVLCVNLLSGGISKK